MARKQKDDNKRGQGPGENKAASSEAAQTAADEQGVAARAASSASVRTHEVPKEKAYGESTPEEHRKSGYVLPKGHYEVPKALEEAKDPGKERGVKRDKE